MTTLTANILDEVTSDIRAGKSVGVDAFLKAAEEFAIRQNREVLANNFGGLALYQPIVTKASFGKVTKEQIADTLRQVAQEGRESKYTEPNVPAGQKPEQLDIDDANPWKGYGELAKSFASHLGIQLKFKNPIMACAL